MNILVSKHPATLVQRFGWGQFVSHMGILFSPRMIPDTAWLVNSEVVWAADNDCFEGLDREAYIAMLKKIAVFHSWWRCKFVTAPDVVGDAQATLMRFRLWRPTLKYYGLPIALVAQDGIENLPIPWEQFEALFIGGKANPDNPSKEWKLSETVAHLVREAKWRGKWVHMGRVTSRQRVAYAASIGCDSVDASAHARFTERTLPLALQGARNYPFTLEGFV